MRGLRWIVLLAQERTAFIGMGAGIGAAAGGMGAFMLCAPGPQSVALLWVAPGEVSGWRRKKEVKLRKMLGLSH